MENDVLKNKIAPWQEKGRWYHGLWNLSTSTFNSTETDAELLSADYTFSTSANTVYIKPAVSSNKRILYAVLKQRGTINIATNHTINIGSHRIYTTGEEGIGFAPYSENSSGFFDVWLFIVKE